MNDFWKNEDLKKMFTTVESFQWNYKKIPCKIYKSYISSGRVILVYTNF